MDSLQKVTFSTLVMEMLSSSKESKRKKTLTQVYLSRENKKRKIAGTQVGLNYIITVTEHLTTTCF